MKNYKWPIILVVCIGILGFVFYWFEWRVAEVKKQCYENSYAGSELLTKDAMSAIEAYYIKCLRKNGL